MGTRDLCRPATSEFELRGEGVATSVSGLIGGEIERTNGLRATGTADALDRTWLSFPSRSFLVRSRFYS